MTQLSAGIPILIADDSDDDVLLARDALRESKLLNPIHVVSDGEELLDFLMRRGPYSAPDSAPRPGLILLDLNLPRLDGLEVLTQIKGDRSLRRIPVVVLSTSQDERDVNSSYDRGANSFISKPVTFERFVEIMGTVGRYWIDTVALPEEVAA